MFKKLLLCAGVVASLNASEDLEVSIENKTSQPLIVQYVNHYYSILSNADIGRGFEIDPDTKLDLKISVVSSRYFVHVHQHIPSDCIKFEVFNLDNTSKKEIFEILWEKDIVTLGDIRSISSYRVEKTDDKFEFILKPVK